MAAGGDPVSTVLTSTILPPGQYLWLHDIRQVADGTPAGVVALALASKARGILPKYDDGQAVSLSDGEQWQGQVRALVAPCEAAGLLLIPWGYVYPSDRTLFATIATQALADTAPANPQGFYGLDVEIEFDNDANPAYDAGQVLADLRTDVPHAVLLYTSWGWVDQHPAFPWAKFQSACQGFIPQVYPGTLQAGVDAGVYWNRAYGGPRYGGPNPGTGPAGFSALSPQIPIVPAFDFAGDTAALAAFAHNFGCPAISWWVMDGMTTAQADQLASTPYAATATPPAPTGPPDPAAGYAEAAWEAAFAAGVMDGTNPTQPLLRQDLAVALDRLGLLRGGSA
jgi:hypothetical protein